MFQISCYEVRFFFLSLFHQNRIENNILRIRQYLIDSPRIIPSQTPFLLWMLQSLH